MVTQSLLLAGLLAGSSATAADAPRFDVMQEMSAADFRATGLDKLSDAQIKALDAWFADYQQRHNMACNATTARTNVVVGDAHAPVDSYPMTAHIVGEFHGWSGDTRVTLDNGEVWEQIDDAMVTSGRMTNPKVTISRGLLNAFYMSVEGINDSVLVKRIKQ